MVFSIQCCKKEAGREDEVDISGFSPGNPRPPPELNGSNLADSLNRLSVQERELLYEEIHGVVGDIEETPEMVESKLQAMRLELDKVPRRKRKAFDIACYLQPSLVHDDNLHLLFLRAERFDPVKAASKMVRHFEHKRLLFGDEKLAKPKITLEDLTPADMAIMRTGAIQFLPVHHTGIQAIYTNMQVFAQASQDWMALTRYAWYVVMAAMEDIQIQKHGIVDITNAIGEYSYGDIWKYVSKSSAIIFDLPYRTRSMQYLCSGSGNNALMRMMGFIHDLSPHHLQIRERYHFGSDLEIQYALMSYGIHLPSTCFMPPGQGIYSREHIEAYIADRRQKEAKARMNERPLEVIGGNNNILYPSPQDVLMGKARPLIQWPGNQRLAELVEAQANIYGKMTDKMEKTFLTIQVLQKLRDEEGSRFIQRTADGWEMVDEALVREKISHAFRTAVREERQQGKRNTSGDNDDNSKSSREQYLDDSVGSEAKRLRASPLYE